jgi:radical SAM protein with 4Fe4S-binding SPASM domain
LKIKGYLAKKKKQFFHFKHELYTKLAYRLPNFPPHRFVFVLTNQCNLKCKDCYQERGYKNNSLRKEEWIRLSDNLPKFSRITVTGGEPLLAPGFKEILTSIAKNHQCNLITNGTILTEEMIEFLLSFPKFKILAISLDGPKEVSMNLRRITERQWEDLERIMKYFIRRRDETRSECLLEIKTLLLDDNADCLSDFHKYCMEDIKADHHTFQLLKGSKLQHSDKLYTIKQIFEPACAPAYKNFEVITAQLEEIRNYNILNNKVAFLHPIMANLISKRHLDDISFLNQEAFNQDLFEPCKFPWSSLHINYDGELFPCLSIPIGNVREKSIRDILQSPSYKEFLSIIRDKGTVPACNRCGWLRLSKERMR